MVHRTRLPDRREAETFNIEVDGQRYTVTAGRFANSNEIAELFINSSGKLGTAADINAADGALAISLALQYGVPIERLRLAMKRNDDGSAQGPLGAALDAVSKIK
jgi:hypothetical protein